MVHASSTNGANVSATIPYIAFLEARIPSVSVVVAGGAGSACATSTMDISLSYFFGFVGGVFALLVYSTEVMPPFFLLVRRRPLRGPGD